MVASGKKLLILGASGLIGSAIAEVFAAEGYQLFAPSHQKCDLRELGSIRSWIDNYAPDMIINCAALLSHETCESKADEALLQNALAPKQLAIAAEEHAIGLVQISTSAVFDGRKKQPYLESDQPAPVNMYGGSKYLGECFVQAYCSRAIIVRLPMVFGPGGTGFINRMALKVRAGESLRGTVDEFCSPLYCIDAAKGVLQLVTDDKEGCFHIPGGEQVSLYQLLCSLRDLLPGESQVLPAVAADFPRNCRMPFNGSLQSESVPKLCCWRDSLPEWLSGGI